MDRRSPFPVSPPTIYSSSSWRRRQQSSSGQEPGEPSESCIDSSDRFRVGGPGLLPEWPVIMTAAPEIPHQLYENLMTLAINQLSRYGIEYDRISLVRRCSKFHTPTAADVTLYICAFPVDNVSQWIIALDDMIPAAERIGFTGRIEIIDARAIGGLKSFPPNISTQLRESWCDIEQRVINRLSELHVDWELISLARRGYWEETADQTVVIVASAPRSVAITISDILTHDIEGYGLKAEVCRPDLLWGLFSKTTKPIDQSILGWPFTRGFNSMGLSIGRADGGITGTLGGYLKATGTDGREQVLGLTCSHILSQRPGEIFDLNVRSSGSSNINIPCSSPSPSDIETAKQQAQEREPNAPQNIQSLSPWLQAKVQTQEANKAQKLREINAYNPNFGTAIAMSGRRNTPIRSSNYSHSILQDWAVILMADDQRSANYIGDFGLPGSGWNPAGVQVLSVIPFESSSFGFDNTPVVKRGRSTSVTLGVLTTICPVTMRLTGVSRNLHHKAWLVTGPSVFAAPGDSGSWVLNSTGHVLGLLIGGNEADGSGLVLPMSLVIEDIEKKMGIPKGGVRLYF